jgi:hypothetical protein
MAAFRHMAAFSALCGLGYIRINAFAGSVAEPGRGSRHQYYIKHAQRKVVDLNVGGLAPVCARSEIRKHNQREQSSSNID